MSFESDRFDGLISLRDLCFKLVVSFGVLEKICNTSVYNLKTIIFLPLLLHFHVQNV